MKHADRLKLFLISLFFSTLVSSGRIVAAMEPTIPDGGQSVIAMPNHLQSDKADLKWESIPVEGEVFKSAIRASVLKKPEHVYDTQLAIPVASAIATHDVLLAVFRVRGRAQQSPEAAATFVFQSMAGYVNSISIDFTVGEKWTTFYFPFEAATTTAAEQAQITFRLGAAIQSMDFGDIQLLNFGSAHRISDLPFTHFSYPGREPDAAWRRAADERIEKIRKSDLSVEVTDSSGKPIRGAHVEINLVRHAFSFGTAVNATSVLNDSTHDGEEYRRQLLRLFNAGTPENAIKWPNIDKSTKDGENLVAWMIAHNLKVRAHNLIWPSLKYMPGRIKKGYDQRINNPVVGTAGAADWLRTEIAAHITKVAGLFSGKVIDWDVVNEPYNQHDALDILGSNVMADWYHLAHAADPHARLFLNDYGILSGGANDTTKQDFIYHTVENLLHAGAPIGGLGFQAHFGSMGTSPEKMLSVLNRYSKLSLPIEITEFDMSVSDEQLQADFTRDILTVAFSHPSICAFTMWGFWQTNHWLPVAALFRSDWTPKPNEKAYESLVLEKWWTHNKGATDITGHYNSRVFKGDLAVTVTAGDRQKDLRVSVGDVAAVARFVMP